jgi:hypothetical protein
MLHRIDARSLVIGLLLGACALLSLGQAPAANPHDGERFQITGVATTDRNGQVRTSIYVLEHRTGQVAEYARGADNQWQRLPAFQISR